MQLRRSVTVSALVSVTALPSSSLAAPAPPNAAPPNAAPPETIAHGFSPYELETIKLVEKKLHGKRAIAPEGKTIEGFSIEALDVIEDRDPVPDWLNNFHARSRDSKIAREILLTEGAPYEAFLAEETARNLRGLSQLSLVLVVPFEGSAPDRVRVVVITKDVWSLRLNWDASYGNGGLERLLLVPSERNILGLHQTVSAYLLFLPLSQTMGLQYEVPRVADSRINFATNANIIHDRTTGEINGSSGGLSLSQPLYSALSEWQWGVAGTWQDSIARHYVNAALASVVYTDPVTKEKERIPWQYRGDSKSAGGSVTRSYGLKNKLDVTAGFAATSNVYTTSDLSRYSAPAVAAFMRLVPVSDTQVGPYLQVRAYQNEFSRMIQMESLGLQEEVRLGPDVYLRASPITRALGSSRDFLAVYGGAQYTVPLGDGYARTGVIATSSRESDHISDAAVEVQSRVASPSFGIGRLVFDARVLNRYRNYLNASSSLGGDTRLRGYPTSFFTGKDYVISNLEFRSTPVELFSCQLGGALFYDVGDAFNTFAKLHPYQGAGLGIRALFPQLDRIVFRADVAVPLKSPLPGDGSASTIPNFGFFLSFAQAIPLGTVAP